MPNKRPNINAKAFVRDGGEIHVVYTGNESRRIIGADVRAIDGRELDLADRVLVLAQDKQGYAGCVITPEPESTTCTASTAEAPTCGNNVRMLAAITAAVGYDEEAAAVAMRACGFDEPFDLNEGPGSKAVKAAARTAIARLEIYGPIDTEHESPLEIAFHALSGLEYDQVILHGARPRTTKLPADHPHFPERRTPDLGDAAIAQAALSTGEEPGLAGSKNNVEELFALTRWFTEEVGGRIIDYNTARSGVPRGTKADGQRRRVVIAVCPDGLAGASVWHVSNDLVTFEGDVKRARREMCEAGLEGLLDPDYKPAYAPFNLHRNAGTAIRRALKSPFQTAAGATPAELASQVLGADPRRPCLRGPGHRQTPLVLSGKPAAVKKKSRNKKPVCCQNGSAPAALTRVQSRVGM